MAEIRSNDIERKPAFGERFAKETRSVNIAVLDKQDPLVSHKSLPRLFKKRRKRITVPQLSDLLRIARFNAPAGAPRLNSARAYCDASITSESCSARVFAAIGRIS